MITPCLPILACVCCRVPSSAKSTSLQGEGIQAAATNSSATPIVVVVGAVAAITLFAIVYLMKHKHRNDLEDFENASVSRKADMEMTMDGGDLGGF